MVKDYEYETGEIIDRKRNHSIKIIEKIWMKNGKNSRQKGYVYECLNCGNIKNITQRDIKKGVGCSYCSSLGIKKEFIYEIGSIVNEELEIINRKLENKSKKYNTRCKNCNSETWCTEFQLNKLKRKCPVCCGRILVKGVNDLKTTNPELMKFLVDKEDGENYMKSSSHKVEVICPECGRIKKEKITLNKLYNRKRISCVCGDGYSYPEKFIYNMLTQLEINFTIQKTFDWAKDKRYDFYIPSLNMIVETHGMQHYEETTRGCTLSEEKLNDYTKEKLARNNGIENYIQLDCRYSDKNWILENIFKNKILKDLIDESKNIDFEKCDSDSLKSMLIKVNKLFNEGIEDINKISGIVNLSYATCLRYIKKGRELGMNNFKERTKSIEIILKDVENDKEYRFNSINSASLETGINNNKLRKALKEGLTVDDKFYVIEA